VSLKPAVRSGSLPHLAQDPQLGLKAISYWAAGRRLPAKAEAGLFAHANFAEWSQLGFN
jgi:hypothetical protein